MAYFLQLYQFFTSTIEIEIFASLKKTFHNKNNFGPFGFFLRFFSPEKFPFFENKIKFQKTKLYFHEQKVWQMQVQMRLENIFSRFRAT